MTVTEKTFGSLSSYERPPHLTVTVIKFMPHIFKLVHAIFHATTIGKKEIVSVIYGETQIESYISYSYMCIHFNPLNPKLNPICYLLALLGAYHFLHISRIRVKLLTLRRLMSYIYMEHPFLMFLDHTRRRSTVGRTPLDE